MSTRQHHLLVLPLSYLLQLPPPSAIQGTIINAPPIGENDHLNENFVDNYSLDADDGGEYTLCQKMVHYCGGHIAVEHLAACKAVLVFQAGCSISKLSSMTKVVKEAAMMELYNASIAALDEIQKRRQWQIVYASC